MRKRGKRTNSIPTPSLERGKGKIDPGVIENIDRLDREAEYLVISYTHYNDRLCGFEEYKRGHLRKVLRLLRKIGSLGSVKQFKAAGIEITPVDNEGEYKKLYRRLPRDADILECYIGSKQRMFFWIIDTVGMFHLVCLTNRHLETRKQRR